VETDTQTLPEKMKTIIEFEKDCLIFENPLAVLRCNSIDNVPYYFDLMEKALNSGYYLAGFISYEAGYAFEECLKQKEHFNFPLICMGIYEKVTNKKEKFKKEKFRAYSINNIQLNITRSDYDQNIETIRRYISTGDVYQITYCIKFNFDFDGDAFSLYESLKKDQPVPYPAYIEADDFTILSLSPELFMKKCGDSIVTKPMKGTWPRGNNLWKDFLAGIKLKNDQKNRAENVMIADLLRNDLGRIGESIKAPILFEVAKYKTLFQMTSTVTATVNRNLSLFELFKALHPSGSVTGAPKIRAMEIIREIEKEERKIYTGAIGFITPEKNLFFNVPIRTILLTHKKGEMGIGGGIIWDSTPESEFDECMLKAKFLLDLAKDTTTIST
jgi:para-aminobenzoate synthetase/4-amino-4-deoxychorismate lyase